MKCLGTVSVLLLSNVMISSAFARRKSTTAVFSFQTDRDVEIAYRNTKVVYMPHYIELCIYKYWK